ncbi:hypothetical protein MHLP_03185 [Candidatus Mycoplasma haematolamae str. Purdue]|uniref:Uncharacterized protein n=1 Tax=Mycoplasma haematolamae (strain Purdue) TaxID=1212765 RepID=I7C6Q9_MYCHA|nr:hypothetical protein [Candidatus Mycoplasma haematolamae]AFO52217.1 hypothetical protein MHLP_03185 [Candidatus Mycoplasma haematolamae str. Purdue]
MWDWLSQFKELSLLGLASLPLAGALVFFASDSFKWSDPRGFFAQVRLFMNRTGSDSTASQVSAVSSAGYTSEVSYQIVQVSGTEGTVQTSSSSDTSKGTLSLILELPIKKLWQQNWYKYCLPNNSPLRKKEKAREQQQLSQSTSVSTSDSSCELKWWEPSKEKDTEEGVIYLLLSLITKWLYLQHAVNMKYISEGSKGSQGAGTQASSEFSLVSSSEASGSSQNSVDQSKIKSACDLNSGANGAQDTNNKLLNTLLLSSDPNRRCYLPPHVIDLTLTPGSVESKPQAAASAAASEPPTSTTAESTNQNISVERIKKGSLTGQIYYGLFDYWGKKRPVEQVTSDTKSTYIYLKRNTPLEYLLADEKPEETSSGSQHSSTEAVKLSLAKLYEKLQNQEVDLEDFKPKSKEK